MAQQLSKQSTQPKLVIPVGFSSNGYRHNLINSPVISIGGLTKSGKTQLALTAPSPINCLSMEPRTSDTVEYIRKHYDVEIREAKFFSQPSDIDNDGSFHPRPNIVTTRGK